MSISRAAAAGIAFSIGFVCFAQTGGERCVVNHPHADRGPPVTAKMALINDGEPCNMRRMVRRGIWPEQRQPQSSDQGRSHGASEERRVAFRGMTSLDSES